MIGRFSLRARLLLGVLFLSAFGLAIADAATYTSLRSFLLGRVDTGLDAAHPEIEQRVLSAGSNQRNGDSNHHGGPDGGPPAQGVDWYQLRSSSGGVLKGGFLIGGGSPPKLPAVVEVGSRTADSHGERSSYFTVSSRDGATSYRVRASIDPQHPNRTLLIATSLHDVLGTLHRLLAIELIATLGVLAGLAAAGLWVVRAGLRPLAQMTATATMIAGGDLSRRVARADDRTEVGRLGSALNTMLGQIEIAFQARRASEDRLRRFIADASHELRTPLAAVRAYAELFSRGASQRPDDLERSMVGIERESKRMSKLIEDLLLLARLDERPSLDRVPLDFADVITEAVETARTLEPSRSIDTRLQPSVVVGDHDRLRQVLDNLFANVRAHTDPQAAVRISLTRDRGSAHLTFADTGPGMPKETAEQIFERFFRADPSRTRTAGGAGLGLSIVAAVVEAHGGTVTARASEGQGTSFTVTLPLADSAAD